MQKLKLSDWLLEQIGGGGSSTDLLSKVYPVGSIIIKDDNTDYSSWLGFTWQKVFAGKVLVGLDTNDTDFNTVGKTGGSKSLQSHSHTVNSHSHSLNNHTHSIPALSGTAASAGAHTHNIPNSYNANLSGSNGSFTGSKDDPYKVATSSAGAHTHNVTTNASTTGKNNGSTGTSSPGTSSAGSGNSGNLQPYQVVVYWKRTA